MRFASRLLLVFCGLLGAGVATAQRRSASDLIVLPEAQVEVALAGNDYVIGAFNLVASTNSGGSTFAAGQLRLGYEHFWNEHWSGGATLRILGGPQNEGLGDFFGQPGNITPGLLLRHTAMVGKFTFGQRLGAEYGITASNNSLSTSREKDRALGRLRLDVERVFPLGEKVAIRPRVAYEAAAYLRLQRNEDEAKERVVDFGSLRAEAGLRLSPVLDLTPWVASQTRYINTLEQFDSIGNQTGGGRTNLLFPLVGLDIRLTLLSGTGSAERRQLPTQH